MNIMQLIMIAFLALMLIQIFRLQTRNKKNTQMLKVLDQFNDQEAFFKACDDYIEQEKTEEFKNKVRVLRLWGDAYYDREEHFKEDLDCIDLSILVNPDGKKKGFAMNEDSFFYMFMAIPNRLAYINKEGLRHLVYAKNQTVAQDCDKALLSGISDALRQYYEGTGDKGQAFMEGVLNGDYGGYTIYSKQMIGFYKMCLSAVLARIALDENNTERFEELLPDLRRFESSKLGTRWLKECNVTLPAEEEQETHEEEKTDEDVVENEEKTEE